MAVLRRLPAGAVAVDGPGDLGPRPGGHDLSAGGDVMDQVAACARSALRLHGCHPDASAELLNVSENATFLVSDPDAGPSVLRVHRLGYHTEREIVSELAWMDALRAEAGVRTPRVLPAADGRRVVTVSQNAAPQALRAVRVPARHRAGRRARRPADRPATSRSWARSPRGCTATPGRGRGRPGSPGSTGTTRPPSGSGPGGDAGRTASASARPNARCSAASTTRSARRLTAFGQGPERYGLVHADTRLANLLVHGGSVAVIDFDDCGFSWYLYDLAAAVSFFEHSPDVPALVDSWLTGYRRAGQLSAEDEAEIWTFILFRRLLLVAWIGSHRGVDIAAELGAGYTQDSCDLAESYLSTH